MVSDHTGKMYAFLSCSLINRKLNEKESLTKINNVALQVTQESLDTAMMKITKQNKVQVIVSAKELKIPSINGISPIAQNALMQAGIINRRKFLKSQINEYLELIIMEKHEFSWESKLNNDHRWIEHALFVETSYWRTDLTAFVNLWDTIDDRILGKLTQQHPELGGYTVGQIGGILGNPGKISKFLPEFFKMINEIHTLRKASFLSHTKISRTNKYTGPISFKRRNAIKTLIKNGLTELVAYW